ncbi:hypothetical protein [Bradyrhizobium lablabi]|uniref:hypothetical protein n=1 Tax=Bradyrhizobium lablabi TaxID=722472 RepID=UPI001BAD316C|nr:hypothetical protein [Bradyrhizobium lablabi]MBR0691753.1 hypothetical protein [Bradyrhizobium lablabi]
MNGLSQAVALRDGRSAASSAAAPNVGSSAALGLCVIGLVGVFLAGYPGYFVFDAIWPSFFYSPVSAGKNAWLLCQAAFIGIYLVGALLMFIAVRRALNAIPATI